MPILYQPSIPSTASPSSDFSRYRIVRPTVLHTRTKREISSTRHSKGIHHPEVTIQFLIDNEEYVLDLKLNMDLVSEDHVISYQQNGSKVQYTPNKEELDICQYSGVVRDKPNSWAAVSTCRGVRGVIYDGHTMKHIEPAEGEDINSSHYIYDHSDLQTSGGSDVDFPNRTDEDQLQMQQSTHNSRLSRNKREVTQFSGPYKSNNLSRYVELVLVADHGMFLAGGDLATVYWQMKDLANIINLLFSSINIYIALVGVVVWSEKDEIPLVDDGNVILGKFAEYRHTRLNDDIRNDNAHLVTKQKFHGNKVGKSYVGAMCSKASSVGVTTLHSDVIGLVASTIAHEIGHNLGMGHDDDNCRCPDYHCIMTPSTTKVMPLHWSSCSLRSLSYGFDRGLDYCLRNKPKGLFGPPTCGNGYLEPGEQCDCGASEDEGRINACRCCNPDTCTLREHALCATGECCDLQTCSPMSAGTVCRAAHKECDLPEHCTGHSEFCPADVFKMDSTPCGTHHEAYCVAGSCKSHSDQCRMLWGNSAKNAHDDCYSYNNLGNEDGDCEAKRTRIGDNFEWQFTKCSSEDILCGRLRCETFEPFQLEVVTNATHVNRKFINLEDGQQVQCYSAFIDVYSNEVDPGLVPDGAKCGDNKMCLKQKCVSIDSVRAEIAARNTSVCPSDCHGHGVCNSEGSCHCEVGFAPPDCFPGHGGSFDSGPASGSRSIHRSGHRSMVVVIYLFIGVLPLVLL